MEAIHDLVVCSSDSTNTKGREGEISLRLPQPLTNSGGGVVRLKKLLISHAKKGPIWVSLDVGEPSVMTNASRREIVGIYHCEGSKLRTYSWGESSIALPLRVGTISSLTLRFYNPFTKLPLAFHPGQTPLIVAHLQIQL